MTMDVLELWKKRPEQWHAQDWIQGDLAAQDIRTVLKEVERLRATADGAYTERNQVVAGLAALAVQLGCRAGTARTAIEGWAPEWHGCVYIDLPSGQCSWHFHDRDAALFAFLPAYDAPWDGHDTPEKYRRVLALTGGAA